MAKIILSIRTQHEVSTLKVSAGVRYWEDGIVDGVEDVNGNLIPCRENDYWCPVIDIDSGVITNWEKGKKASVHYKVCDDGEYEVLNKDGKTVVSISGYVISSLCPKGNGYGDYIIMDIDENGKIDGWKFVADDFSNTDYPN